jgi:hypothetical protein
MNKQLFELYSSKWDELCAAMSLIIENKKLAIKPTNPLLLTIDDEEAFKKSDIRVMIFGQETNDWEKPEYNNDIQGDDVQYVLDIYNYFYHTGACYIRGGQFWTGVNRFRKMLAEKHPAKKISYVWNNVVKIGKFNDKGCPPDYIYDAERNCFSVIKEEIDIIKPNVILFLTGPDYDNKISDIFGKLTYAPLAPFSERELSKISIPNVDVAFRTYHPGYLWRNNIGNYFNVIINEIK